MKKKIVSILIVFTLLISLNFCVFADEEVKYGDANGDQKVDTQDLIDIIEYSYKNSNGMLYHKKMTDIGKNHLDVNFDGVLDRKDSTLLGGFLMRYEEYYKSDLIMGDLNEDEKVNYDDVRLLVDVVDTNKRSHDKSELVALDFDMSGCIDKLDLYYLKWFVKGRTNRGNPFRLDPALR